MKLRDIKNSAIKYIRKEIILHIAHRDLFAALGDLHGVAAQQGRIMDLAERLDLIIYRYGDENLDALR